MSTADHQCEHLVAFLRELNRNRDLQSLARVVLEQAVSLVPGAQRGSFMLLDRDEDCFQFRAAVGWPLQKLRQVVVPSSQLLQQLAFGDRPAIVREPYKLDREHGLHALAESFQTLFGPVRAILSMPVFFEGTIIAYLNLDNIEDPDSFQ